MALAVEEVAAEADKLKTLEEEQLKIKAEEDAQNAAADERKKEERKKVNPQGPRALVA